MKTREEIIRYCQSFSNVFEDYPFQSFDAIKISMEKNIKYIDKPKKNINFHAVINFTQLIHLCIENSDLLVKEEIENTVKKLLENLADEIFEEES